MVEQLRRAYAMNRIELAIENTLGKEGGFVDHPSDRGGPTKWGITQDTARRNGYAGRMQDLDREQARDIYRNEFFLRPRFNDVLELSQTIGEELFDTGVNCGVGTSGQFLQRSLNVLNQRAKLFPDLKVDGMIGDGTLRALKAYLAARGAQGELVLMRMLNALQGGYYVAITEKREANEDFIFGWFLNRVAL